MPISVQRQTGGRDFSGATTDISFLLIIFFLVSAVFVSDKGIYLRVPREPTPPRELTLDQVVLIQVSSDSPGFILNTSQSLTFDQLGPVLAGLVRARLPLAMVLQVEPQVPYDTVIKLMELGRSLGIELFSVSAGDMALAVDLGAFQP